MEEFPLWLCGCLIELLGKPPQPKLLEWSLEDSLNDFPLLFFLHPPPTGTFRRDPPLVQYLLQPLQKYLGCVKL
jgi:hypothetical protein